MKPILIYFLLAALASQMALPITANASPKQKKPSVPPTADWVPDAGLSVSKRINALLDRYLENNILAPLDVAAPSPRKPIETLQMDFTVAESTTKDPQQQKTLGYAISLCNSLSSILDQRQQAQLQLVNLATNNHTASIGGSPSDWDRLQATLGVMDRRNTAVMFQMEGWNKRTETYRPQIERLATTIAIADAQNPPALSSTPLQSTTSAPAATPSPVTANTAAAPVQSASPAQTQDTLLRDEQNLQEQINNLPRKKKKERKALEDELAKLKASNASSSPSP